MRYSVGFGLLMALVWGQSPSWGRAQVDSARSVIPRYMVSPVAQTNTRLPYFAILRVTGLEPNRWYRYVSRMDNATAAPPSLNINLGAGNPIYYNVTAGTYSRTTAPSLYTAGGYDSVLTDGNGEAELRFGLEPTGNQRFRTDGGNQVYIKVFLLSVAPSIDSAYVIGDKTPIQPLALRTPNQCTAGTDTCGSFIYDTSSAVPGTLVFLYDQYGPRQLGERPLAGAVVESIGITWPNSVLAAYTTHVSTSTRRYGTLIPNTCTGVKAIYYGTPGGCETAQAIFDQDGNWPSGISTVSPTNGPAAVGLLNSLYYPLLPDPGNSCLNVSSSAINPSTGSIYIGGYTVQPTQGFLYGFTTRLPGGAVGCAEGVGPHNVPANIPWADSSAPPPFMGGDYIYGLCYPSAQWGQPISPDSIPGTEWPEYGWSMSNCQPCSYYSPVEGTFYWRCFSGEAGFLVQNFTYYGDETNPNPGSFYSTATVTLPIRRVPKKVTWQTPPPPAVNPGDPFTVEGVLVDSLTPASWGGAWGPNFSNCGSGWSTVNLYVLDQNNTLVSTFTSMPSIPSPGMMPIIQFVGTWPSTPGQYKVVIGDVPFPSCPCTMGMGSLTWRHSDTLQVTISSSTSLPMQVLAQPSAWEVHLPAREGQLLLYDSRGQLLWHATVQGTSTLSVPRQGLPAGIYTLVWRSFTGITTQKVLHLE
ncbi:MAG: hypothetical protein N3A68_04510 [Bacteroidia bacterium]|nr:hypothetical protein [Bacteroidia bacterium]